MKKRLYRSRDERESRAQAVRPRSHKIREVSIVSGPS